ncbi:hypothetical protein [Streptococcus parasanguinis]|uniref:hypothetical protein n=1 Tax=Streptococcus parasanguinis TaxID=1318 RepID=UPI001EF9E856|nr:hypothetical protein [Streptococcus parasanguinis]
MNRMKYLKALSFRTKVIMGLALLALFASSAYSYAWPKYVQWKEDHEVQIVKTKVERIETFGSQNRYVFHKTSRPNGSYVLSNHFVTKNAKFVGRGSNQPVELSFDVYDLNHLKNPPKKIDVVKLLQTYDQRYKLDFQARRGYSDNGRDYMVLSLVNKENDKDKKEVALDLESEKIMRALSEDKTETKWIPFSFSYTNLDDITTEYGFISYYDLSYNEDDDGRKNTNLNFLKEYPSYYKDMKGLARVEVRQGDYNDPEAIFQDMRHWFAPVGQDKLDVIATDPKTNEQTPINTYQEYKEWYETHRDHL